MFLIALYNNLAFGHSMIQRVDEAMTECTEQGEQDAAKAGAREFT
jgi:hypothetical protein